MEKSWYRLDNAAKIFPVTRDADWGNNFRVSVTLRDEIEPVLLQKALERTLPRFPNFSLTLRHGFFWFYLEEQQGVPQVQPDVSNPMVLFSKKHDKQNFQFRVRYYKNRISVELFHVLADGNSAMFFLKTLAAQYLELLGHPIPTGRGVFDVSQPPSQEEMEDAYQKYAQYRVKQTRKEKLAYRPYYPSLLAPQQFRIITGQVKLEKLLEQTKKLQVTVTEYITAALIYSFLQKQEQEEAGRRKRPVKICVPVNLRSFYRSKTFRNFILYANPGIDPRYGEFTFEEIAAQVHHYMKFHVTEKNLNAMMSKNMSSEQNPVLKVLPLFLKKLGMRVGYYLYGERLSCATFSNIGLMDIPDEMKPYVKRFDFLLNWPKDNLQNVSGVGYNGMLNITFSSKAPEADIERIFFTFLVKQGIPVKIESNL